MVGTRLIFKPRLQAKPLLRGAADARVVLISLYRRHSRPPGASRFRERRGHFYFMRILERYTHAARQISNLLGSFSRFVLLSLACILSRSAVMMRRWQDGAAGDDLSRNSCLIIGSAAARHLSLLIYRYRKHRRYQRR